MSKITKALRATTALMQAIDLGDGLMAHVIDRPIERVATEALFKATNHQLATMPIAATDDLPYVPEDADDQDTAKKLQKIVGKIRTQRQYQAVLIGLQQQAIWRAMLSLVDSEGRIFAETEEDEIDLLRLLSLKPELVSQIEKLAGWGEYDAKKAADAKDAEKAARIAGPQIITAPENDTIPSDILPNG